MLAPTEAIAKQLLLGKSLVDQFGLKDVQSFPQLVQQVVGRDPRWLTYYKDFIGGLDVGDDQKLQAAETDTRPPSLRLGGRPLSARGERWHPPPLFRRLT